MTILSPCAEQGPKHEFCSPPELLYIKYVKSGSRQASGRGGLENSRSSALIW